MEARSPAIAQGKDTETLRPHEALKTPTGSGELRRPTSAGVWGFQTIGSLVRAWSEGRQKFNLSNETLEAIIRDSPNPTIMGGEKTRA